MDFARVLREVPFALQQAGLGYALIGGLAMAAHGVVRATADVDLLVMMSDLEQTEKVLAEAGFRRVFRTPNVSHYLGETSTHERVDILHAFRPPSLAMLHRAKVESLAGISLRIAAVEDIIGLKVQATVNDATRFEHDWLDIRLLVEAAARRGYALDWELLRTHLALFSLTSKVDLLRNWHDAAAPTS